LKSIVAQLREEAIAAARQRLAELEVELLTPEVVQDQLDQLTAMYSKMAEALPGAAPVERILIEHLADGPEFLRRHGIEPN